MRKRRLIAGIVLALMLSPGTLLRTQIPSRSTADLTITRLADLPDETSNSGFTRMGVWELSSSRIDFGGYSALLVLNNATLRAFSDRGKRLTFAEPGQPQDREAQFATVWDRGDLSPTVPDIEAATRDPETGDYWLAFENTHAVIRNDIASAFVRSRRPSAWQDWPENGGAEAMARFPDGRFIILPERDSTGFLYASDPTDEVEPLTFDFTVPADYNPTDMMALPDGRVLILLRQLEWGWPPFATAIAIADPRGLTEGGTLDIELLIRLETILPRENYEALSLAGVEEDGTVILWLMSDDNLSAFQRTLLAKMSWREKDAGHEKAREE